MDHAETDVAWQLRISGFQNVKVMSPAVSGGTFVFTLMR
jgi:hypothetical protein